MKKQFVFLSILIVFLVIIGLYRTSEQVTQVNNKRIYDSINKTLALLIKDMKEQSLTISLSLSTNSDITDAINKNDSTRASSVLKEATKHLKEHLKKKDLYAQIIKKDYTIFARSWEKIPTQKKLDYYRSDLNTLQEPFTDFDIEKVLSVKSTTPIFYNNEVIGYLEITSILDDLVAKIRDLYSIELIPLMDDRFENVAHFIKNNTRVSKYIVGSGNTNKNIVHRLRRFSSKELTKLTKGGILQKGSIIFISYPIRNSDNERLGELVAAVSTRTKEIHLKEDENFLKQIFTINVTQDDIFKSVNIKDNKIYNTLDFDLLMKLDKQDENIDKAVLRESIKEKLNAMDKDELVDIILNTNKKKVITGEIR